MGMDKILTVLLVSFSCINVIRGAFHYDLFYINALDASSLKVEGIEAAAGPIAGTVGINFNKNTGTISLPLNNTYFAYIADLLQRSNDITFAVYFKIMSTKKNTQTYFPFFALANKRLKKNYFSIGLESKQDYKMVEGKREYNNGTRWSVNIEQYHNRLTRATSLPSFEEDSLPVELGQWMTLMVRIKKDKVAISLNCKQEATGLLGEGRIGAFRYEGKLTFSQMTTSVGDVQFVGSMYEPQLISGQLAYDWYNPCTRNNTPSEIKPESKAYQYNSDKFQQYQRMSLQKNPRPVIYCKDDTGTYRRNNGDEWNKKGSTCHEYRCVEGKIKSYYNCPPCEKYGKEYEADETWIDKFDKCKQWKCVETGEIEVEAKAKTIVCEDLALKCPDPEDQYKPPGACCTKCRQDDCTNGTKWYNSCEKKCLRGAFKCKRGTERKACWCPKNKAWNLKETECIPTGECACKVDSGKIYLPGQSIRRSLCSNCICQHGVLNCFDICK